GVTIFRNPQKLRNEALDVRVYAIAARMILRPNWEKLRSNLEARAEVKRPERSGLQIPAAKSLPRRRWIGA
ncbi:MAG: hypothetical protein ACO3LT_07590, partial [Ilumatobacteraceae bacterium]